MWFPDNGRELEEQVEYAQETVKKAPPKRPGDKYPLAGALIGIVAGAVTGVVLAGWSGLITQFIGVVCGGIIGTLLGSLVGFIVSRFHIKKSNLKYY